MTGRLWNCLYRDQKRHLRAEALRQRNLHWKNKLTPWAILQKAMGVVERRCKNA